MFRSSVSGYNGMRGSALLLMALLAILIGATACRDEQKVDVMSGINAAKLPTMTTKNIATLISDSGVVQYKIVAPLWLVYDEVDTPYWNFPKGLYLQKFDAMYKVIATVAADSAKFFKREKLWRLDGHVEMTKVPKDKFLSERLFWSQSKGKIYSDTFIHIETATHVLEGIGFESDERLTSYRILQPQAIFPVKRDDFVGPGAPGTPGAPAASAASGAPAASAVPVSAGPNRNVQ